MKPARARPCLCRGLALSAAMTLVTLGACASEFSVSPISIELKPDALTETVTVTNHAKTRLRVSIRLMEWKQDAEGKDVYTDTGDIVYFPRQMDVEPQSKRLVRLGAKHPAAGTERTYRLFIEEQPEAAPDGRRGQVSFFFRFGVPIFLAPVDPKPQPEVTAPTLDNGKVSLAVRNDGNQHVRVTKISVSDGAGFSREVAGWYALPGTQRAYTVDLPRDACRKATSLDVVVEGEGLRVDRKLHVDPARCG